MKLNEQELMNKAADALRWASQSEGEQRQLLHLLSAYAYVSILAEYGKKGTELQKTADKLAWDILDGLTSMCYRGTTAAANPKKLKAKLLR